MSDSGIRLRDLRGSPRLFLSAFLVVMSAGYFHGLYFVDFTTHSSAEGTVIQFRGNEDLPFESGGEIKYAKTLPEMLNIIHSHLISFALIFFGVGGVFLFSTVKDRLKAILALEPFVATLVLFGGMWGVRYAPEGLWSTAIAWTMLLAGVVTAICFTVMVSVSLWEMWRGAPR